MPNLTIRNLTQNPLKITHTSRFKLPGPKPITKDNITDIGNIARNVSRNVTNLFRRSPVSTILPGLKQPKTQQVADNAKSFEERDVNVDVGYYSGKDTGLNLDDSTLRLDFEVTERQGDAQRVKQFRVDIPSSGTQELQVNPRGDVGDTSLVGFYIKSRNCLAIVSNASLSSWMGKLNDSTFLGALSIPGTHNSPTHHVALPSVRCQSVSITEQLNNGVRFLDIRAMYDDRELTLVHGAFDIAISGPKKLSDAMDECYNFLDRNRSETIVVSLKREGRGETNDQDFSKLIKEEVVDKSHDHWYVDPTIPNLGNTRGKCILFRRYQLHDSLKSENGGRGYGINAESWADNTPDFTTPNRINVQDFYEIRETENIGKKIQYVKDQLDRSCTQVAAAEKDKTQPPLFINFLSGSNFWKVDTWPDRIAAKINPAITEYLAVDSKVDGGNSGTGIVIYDFAGEGGNWAISKLVVGINGGLLVN
ncbi:PLC-like phosphodiesterase [Wilcoxina mikolae CBS 423.85]|nr:PLC-like phosphodiesterase [Wilcoxina mikolae CBS 423.85]